MEITYLQDLADEAAKEEEPNLDFPLPEECDTTGLKLMEIKDVESKGKGFHAKNDIEAGALLLVSKPLGIIMGWEEDAFDDLDDEEGDDEDESMGDDPGIMKSNRRNGVLAVKVAKAIKDNPKLWHDQISKLFPRDKDELPIWVCEHPETGMEFERSINELKEKDEFKGDKSVVEEIRLRLPFIVIYNCLSVETAPELFVYPDQSKGGHISLLATALYNEPSYFNHSHEPNVSRWSLGDIIFFVVNQDVKTGTELCISYIESELLCEDAKTRSALLEMDFEDLDSDMVTTEKKVDDDDDNDDDYVAGPVINPDVQDELMSIYPLNRLDEINRLLRQSTGEGNEEDMDEEEAELVWLQCDAHRLRTLLALTYENLGQPSRALEEWKKCIEFTTKKLPPADEACTAIYVQAALGANATGQETIAKQYADIALANHDLIFGGGVSFFRRRYVNEIKLELRASKNALLGQAALDKLWPIEN